MPNLNLRSIGLETVVGWRMAGKKRTNIASFSSLSTQTSSPNVTPKTPKISSGQPKIKNNNR